MHEECGIFGIYLDNEKDKIARLSYLGLLALQHRGQESAGIAVNSGSNILVYRDLGLVAEVFKEGILNTLQGNCSCGHVTMQLPVLITGKTVNLYCRSLPVALLRWPTMVI